MMNDTGRQNRSLSNLTFNELYEVHSLTREVITTSDGVESIIPNGTLNNIKKYAELSFQGDKDQEIAFIQIVAAFVVRLHEKTKANNTVSKRFSNGKRRFDFSKPLKVWVRDGQIDHIATLTDARILALLQNINERDDGIDYIALSRLNLLQSDKIEIKWENRSDTELVDWSKVRLIGVPSEQRSTRDEYLQQLREILNKTSQFLCFLSGAGGTGKSEVINTVRHYCKLLYNELGIEFTKRTIVVTAITGSAAVSIHGETMHSSCDFNSKMSPDEDWKNTIMVVVDEISFIKRCDFEKLNTILNAKCEVSSPRRFGNLQMIFAGDFCQLKPPDNFSQPLYTYKDLGLWHEGVDTFLELKTNHRFKDDPEWGELLERYRADGPSTQDIEAINKRVVGEGKHLSAKDLPDNLCYAAKTNLDRNAINDAIFKKLIEETHSKELSIPPSTFVICIKASRMKQKVSETRQTYKDMNPMLRNIVHSCCGDAHVAGGRGNSQHYDPLLKLYVGCPVMITENLDVANSMANGLMCTFKGVQLKNPNKTLDCINIDGYYVNCVEADDVEYMEVELQEHRKDNEPGDIKRLKPQQGRTLKAKIPLPEYGSPFDHKTKRTKETRIQFWQFPLNISNARTVHKLQGRSIDNLVVSSFDYTDNWIYVVLSRVKTIKGLFLTSELNNIKTRGMSALCLQFHNAFRDNKSPQNMYDNT